MTVAKSSSWKRKRRGKRTKEEEEGGGRGRKRKREEDQEEEALQGRPQVGMYGYRVGMYGYRVGMYGYRVGLKEGNSHWQTAAVTVAKSRQRKHFSDGLKLACMAITLGGMQSP